jgi:ferritin-like metal-binding protein YciE
MANTREDNLMAWLRDAHAMEHQAIEMLEKMANRLEGYPELQARTRQHLDETHRQADMVLKCIERRGGSTSMVKDAAGKLIGTGQALSGLFVSDEVVKGALASCTFERYEASSYRILAATAEEVGDQETKRVCEELMRQEEAMGDWLWQHLPQVTRQYLQQAS